MKINLRDMLKSDFGYDLKITGGLGQSRNDPIAVVTSDPKDAALTEMLTLRGIGKGRGILWRTIARTPLKHDGVVIDQVKIETKSVNNTEVITQRENYYFRIQGSTLDKKSFPVANGYFDKDIGLFLPYEIGWMHYDNVIDNNIFDFTCPPFIKTKR